MPITFRHAGAGSGKTYSIEQDIGTRLAAGRLEPEHLIAVTFTNRAADELVARIGAGLLRRDRPDLAARLDQAYIGTVHSVCGRLLQELCFDLGLSPVQRVITDRDQQRLFNEALEHSLTPEETTRLNALAARLCLADWQDEVRALVDQVRANDFAVADLARFADDSVAGLLVGLPSVDATLNEAGLRAALEQAGEDGRAVVNPTKKLQTALEKIEKILHQDFLTWEDWVRASKLSAGVNEIDRLLPAISYGARVLQCPSFRADVEALIRGLFAAAGEVLEAFARLKQERGLVDFVDQEHLMLRALEQEGVRAQLRPRLGLLVVDEFQDTSPIQLALFTRLAALAGEVLFVGDAKQAIYGFRGSDPRLTLDAIRSIAATGGQLEQLDANWRSRPALVHLVNDLFTAPFAPLLTAAQVRLSPRREERLATAPLGWWQIPGGNQEQRTLALVDGVRALVAAGGPVWDKTADQARPVTWRDIAILCRSNEEVDSLAKVCAQRGVPTASSREGLLATPEVTLALACLRRLADPTDRLAAAEILSLAGGTDAGGWLDDRLTALTADTPDDWGDRASPLLARLAAARVDLGRLSPDEALATAIQIADLHRIVLGWDEAVRLTDHRLANLARLGELAGEYLEHCRARQGAASVAGLILWLEDLEQAFDDEQAPNPGNALTLSTYHGAKGLEWPVVIAASLDTDLKVSLYGPRVLAAPPPFDWVAPLAGRKLRYWPDPFPVQQGKDPLTDILRNTPAWAEASAQAREEALQLLYVGLTRARDCLILTATDRTPVGRWLSLLQSPHFPPAGDVLTLAAGGAVPVLRTSLATSVPGAPPARRPRHWLTPPAGAAEALPYLAPPSAALPTAAATGEVVHDFGRRLTLSGTPDLDTLGQALHHALALALTQPAVDRALLQELFSRYPGVVLDADEVLARAAALREWLDRSYPGGRLHSELPFSHTLATGQRRNGQIDLALERPDGWVIVDHKSNPQPKAEWLPVALRHSGQLAAYAGAVEALSGKPVLATLIHFSVSGGLVRVSGLGFPDAPLPPRAGAGGGL